MFYDLVLIEEEFFFWNFGFGSFVFCFDIEIDFFFWGDFCVFFCGFFEGVYCYEFCLFFCVEFRWFGCFCGVGVFVLFFFGSVL